MNDATGFVPPNLDAALSMIRDYARRKRLTPSELCETFSAGIVARHRADGTNLGHREQETATTANTIQQL